MRLMEHMAIGRLSDEDQEMIDEQMTPQNPKTPQIK